MKKLLLLLAITMQSFSQVKTFQIDSIAVSKNEGKEIDFERRSAMLVTIDEDRARFQVDCNCPLRGVYEIKSKMYLRYQGNTYPDYTMINCEYSHVAVFPDALYFYFAGSGDYVILLVK